MESISKFITERYMTGFIRDYLVYIFSFIILVVGGAMWFFDGFSFDPSKDAPANFLKRD